MELDAGGVSDRVRSTKRHCWKAT